MRGQVWIDNEDIFARFGVVVETGGYDELAAFPPLREPEKNDWPEEDGIEVDLDHPCLKEKEVTLSFVATDPQKDAGAFLRFLAQPGYRTVRVDALQKEWRLRLLSQTAFTEHPGGTAAFKVKLADDFPYRPEASEPQGGGVGIPVSACTLDGVSFDRYGLAVEAGGETLAGTASLKQGLTRQFAGSDGRWYDTGQVVFGSKEATFKCCLVAVSMERFWACYDAFFHRLLLPGERRLGWNGREYGCYYKQLSGFRFVALEGQVVAAFSLTWVLTATHLPAETNDFLATEDGAFISTEDGAFIDVTPLSVRLRPEISGASVLSGLAGRREPEEMFASSGTSDLRMTGESAERTEAAETEIRKRKISEMPEVSATEGLMIPAVDPATGRNVRVAAGQLGGHTGGSGEAPASTLGGLTNVAEEADTADDGCILVKKDGFYRPQGGVLTDIGSLMEKVFPLTARLEGGGTFEKGSEATVTLNWSFDRPVESQSLNGEPLAADVRTATFGPIRDDRVYTLTATAGNQTVSRTAEVCFRLKKYYGVSPSETLTDPQIRELASAWAAPQQAETRFDCTGGKYPYYILPASMAGGVRFWVGGLQNTDWQEERREVANASGYAETYAIFRLNRIQTGVLNIEIR